jgi:hypothetical protein
MTKSSMCPNWIHNSRWAVVNPRTRETHCACPLLLFLPCHISLSRLYCCISPPKKTLVSLSQIDLAYRTFSQVNRRGKGQALAHTTDGLGGGRCPGMLSTLQVILGLAVSLPLLLFGSEGLPMGTRPTQVTAIRRKKLMKLALITIVTANLEQLQTFYREVLQIEPQIYRGNYVEFTLEAGTLALWRQSECEA